MFTGHPSGKYVVFIVVVKVNVFIILTGILLINVSNATALTVRNLQSNHLQQAHAKGINIYKLIIILIV
jgi:hypothetical protein